MFREISASIRKWYEEGMNRPLLITGIKGCGKTYSVLEFAAQEFQQYNYINFENDGAASSFFNLCSISEDFFETLGNYLQQTGEIVRPLLVLDEIWACPNIVSLIKNSIRSGITMPVIIISSYLEQDGYNLLESFTETFGPGSIEHIRMYPLSFSEYLTARDKEWYEEVIRGHFEKKKPVPMMINEELLDLFDEYLQIGGMPNAVNEYLRNGSFDNISERQLASFSALGGASTTHKESDVLNVIVKEWAQDSDRFVFTLIRRGVTYSMYNETIRKLCINGMVYKCAQLLESDKVQDETSATKESSAAKESDCSVSKDESGQRFRLYLPDFGMLYALLKKSGVSDVKVIRKAVLSNYVFQELVRKHNSISYWQSEHTASVDFCICESYGIPYPVQIDYFGRNRNRSLNMFDQIYNPKKIFRVGEENFKSFDKTFELPLYAVYLL